MSTKEQALIGALTDLAQQGLITPYELDWCSGAVRSRPGLTRTTRHLLRDSVLTVLKQARSRSETRLK
jgi:hypothetical protein